MRRLLIGLLLGGLVLGQVDSALANHLATPDPWPTTISRSFMDTPPLPSDPRRAPWLPQSQFGFILSGPRFYGGGYGDAPCDAYHTFGSATHYCAGDPSPAAASDGPGMRSLALSAGDGSAPVAVVVWRQIGGRGPLELFYLPSTR